MFDKPLPCFGCALSLSTLSLKKFFEIVLMGSVSAQFPAGFAIPLMWYYATILYFSNYYRRDPRERSGLAASAIAALVFSITLAITLASVFL
ncbi:unnamed protein product [Spirodela intermedia]|uniref:Uncharacterized protein n=1 Tax=Spirodela intermedia TaxID=51605 RepID=A0A7I8JCN0_SPIIN|nr:unnamed protein product [Spirodela intermedia]CAA6667926.1 unnamed protein product [Spirodela intermedia]